MKKLFSIIVMSLIIFLWDFFCFLTTSLPMTEPQVFLFDSQNTINKQLNKVDPQLWINQRYRYYFIFSVELIKLHHLRAGDYQLTPAMTYGQWLKNLWNHQLMVHRITFIEGTRFKTWREVLKRNSALHHSIDAFDDATVMQAMGAPVGYLPEGYFFPDTYQFYRGTSDITILQLAWKTMQKHLTQAWERRDKNTPYRTPAEMLTMASLIEAEAHAPAERAQIAGVFVRRLQKGMRLQCDPTILYGLGYDNLHAITKSELQQNTPYNTYVINGLPPTPIAMPGLAAINAAAHPAAGDALYFVARGDGSHYFSSTLAAHEQAVLQYQRKKKMKAQQPINHRSKA